MSKYGYKNWRKKRRTYIKELRSKPCSDCKKSYPWYVMEFDHCRGTKSFSIAESQSRGISIDKLHKELEKCDLVCGNCHSIRTYNRKVENIAG